MLILSPFILDLINCIKLILSTFANQNSLLICKVGRQFRICFYSFVMKLYLALNDGGVFLLPTLWILIQVTSIAILDDF